MLANMKGYAHLALVLVLLQAGLTGLAMLGEVLVLGGNPLYLPVPLAHAALLVVAGIDPDHVPALLAPVVLLAVQWFRRRPAAPDRLPPLDVSTRTFGWLMAVSAAVHIGLPLGHHDSPALTVAFLGSGVAYGWVAHRALTGRRYRALAVPLI